MLCCPLGKLEGFTTEFCKGRAGNRVPLWTGLALRCSKWLLPIPIALGTLQIEMRTSFRWRNRFSFFKIIQFPQDPRVTLWVILKGSLFLIFQSGMQMPKEGIGWRCLSVRSGHVSGSLGCDGKRRGAGPSPQCSKLPLRVHEMTGLQFQLTVNFLGVQNT